MRAAILTVCVLNLVSIWILGKSRPRDEHPDAPSPLHSEVTYVYECDLIRVIDGDTVELDIDLGFFTWLREQRIRLLGIDAPK